MSRTVWMLVLIASAVGAETASGQASSAEQISGALLAAPETLRDGATVLGYGGEPRAGDPLTVLRTGSNDLICLADDPQREGFHVACYHASLDEYMLIGRRISADGGDRAAVLAARFAALEEGRIRAPAAALWSLTAAADVDPANGPPDGARRLAVVYVPHAEAGSTGLPTRPDGDSPWLMMPGTPWAHIMIPR
ncbi:MAG: hypothetical protein OEM96_02675 [Gemmatimonadota bacterium]|nr:hypothetical protein [Gemmatimonadota bacterium]